MLRAIKLISVKFLLLFFSVNLLSEGNRTLAYGIEFASGTIGEVIAYGLSTALSPKSEERTEVSVVQSIVFYTLFSTFITGSSVYMGGKLYQETGSFANAVKGALIGSILGDISIILKREYKKGIIYDLSNFLCLFAPPLFSVIFYNKK